MSISVGCNKYSDENGRKGKESRKRGKDEGRDAIRLQHVLVRKWTWSKRKHNARRSDGTR